MDLAHPQRLIFVPSDKAASQKADGGMDWTKVKSILLIGREDTHE
jgi:hypothetical protein